MEKILIIDDELIYRTMLKQALIKEGYTTLEADSGQAGVEAVMRETPDLVLTDFRMPGMDGLEVLAEIRKLYPKLPVVLFTAFGDVALTIRSIQVGAFDFLEKPFNPTQLKITVHNALNSVRLSNTLHEVAIADDREETQLEANIPIGKTIQMKEIFKNIGRISMNKVNILIQGEMGTGKELMARLIHFAGAARTSPFMIVSCRTLTEAMLEAELFGLPPDGSIAPGAVKKGKIELAGDGTLFLDEIAELSMNTQVKLLRVIEELELEKPGGETVPMRARIIAATSRDLDALVREGKFREDLYYRLKVFTFSMPPLRERKEDIRDLVIHFMHKLNKRLKKNVVKIGDGVLDMLQSHEWFGNVRELENTILQAIILAKSDVLEKENINLNKRQRVASEPEMIPMLRSLSDMEKFHIERILNEVRWNKVEASRILEITRPTLNAKIEKYRLRPSF